MINSLKKMFGGSKSYYLELEPAEQGEADTPQAPAVEAVTTEQPAAEPVAPAAKEAAPKKPVAPAVAQPVPQPPAPVSQPAPAAPPEPVATAFASSYLLPVASLPSRRRPGPSMSKFLDMARDYQSRR